jgi:hypothetical protein
VINSFAVATPWLEAPMNAYATYAPVCFAALLLGRWWRTRRRCDPRAMAAAVGAPVATMFAVAFNQPIASLIGEPRPYVTLLPPVVLVTRSGDPALPSDHAVMAGAAKACLFLVTRGLLLGASVALLGWLLLRSMLTHLITWLRGTGPRPLVATTNDHPAPVHPVAATTGRR